MNYYALIPLAAFIINFFTFTYIHALKRKSSVNRAYLLFAGNLAALSLASFTVWSLDPGPWILPILRSVSITWLMLGFFFLNFTYAFLKKQKDYLYYISLVSSISSYGLCISTDLIVIDFKHHYWGYYEVMGTAFPVSIILVLFFPFIYSIGLIYKKTINMTDNHTKKQLSLLIQGTVVFLLVTLLSDIISMQIFEVYQFLTVSTTGTVLQSLFVFRAVNKYNFLSIGVEEVSYDLFTNIKDGVVLVDPKESIIQINESAKEIFKINNITEALKVSSLFENYNFDKPYKNYETRLRETNGQTIVSLSQAPVIQYKVELGKLLIVRDITENKKAEEALRQSTIELEKLAGKLAETNLSLERKVAERTQSLQDSNLQLRQQIAERERAEAERAAEQERLAVTLRSIGDGVITTDTDGHVVLLNQVAEELIGWQPAEALGQPLQQVCRIRDESTQTPLESAAQEALRHNEIVNRPRPTLLVASDGTERLIAESGAPIRAQDGTVIGAVLVFRDVTERRKIEEELVKADRLESIGVLAGGIAHDFNNILTAILGNVSLAKLFAGENEKLSTRLHHAEKASLRAQDLTQQLLTFSKGGSPVKQTASLKELIQESVDFSLRGSNVKCKLDLEEGLWPGHIDAGQISQVIHNLIINADQAMPNGGILSVAAVNTDLRDDRRARLLSLDKGHYVHITITDEGVGIEEERLQKIFDPYFTTKPQGSGLGLFTSYSIIKKHDGHIEAQSTVGVGTTFSIYLPAATEVPAQVEPAPDSVAEGTGKILVMEDEESLIEVMGSMLEHYGYDVVFAHDGDETLTTYQQANDLGAPFDALILDLTIPGGMGGKETVTKLLAINPQIKAIVASGYANDPIMSEFRQYGFQGCIAKPYQADALHQVLRQVMAGTRTEPAEPICHSEKQNDNER